MLDDFLCCWQDGVYSSAVNCLDSLAGLRKLSTWGVKDDVKDPRFHRSPRKLEHDYIESSESLGSGCSGHVKLCSLNSDSAELKFAVKRVRPNSTMTQEMIRAEVQNHLRADCPHIVRLLDVYESREHVALVMECLEGGDLKKRLKQKRFSEEDAIVALQQILSSLDYLHGLGIVHCDVKLENFVYDKEGSDQLKLIDFGFSQAWHAGSEQTLDDPLGTLPFTAPELLQGSYTSQCDLWSVGVVAFMLLSGLTPFPQTGSIDMQKRDICTGSIAPKMSKQAARWSTMSNEAKSFIRSLLEADPSKRLTAKEALEHTWLATKQEEDPCRCLKPSSSCESVSTHTYESVSTQSVSLDSLPTVSSSWKSTSTDEPTTPLSDFAV